MRKPSKVIKDQDDRQVSLFSDLAINVLSALEMSLNSTTPKSEYDGEDFRNPELNVVEMVLEAIRMACGDQKEIVHDELITLTERLEKIELHISKYKRIRGLRKRHDKYRQKSRMEGGLNDLEFIDTTRIMNELEESKQQETIKYKKESLDRDTYLTDWKIDHRFENEDNRNADTPIHEDVIQTETKFEGKVDKLELEKAYYLAMQQLQRYSKIISKLTQEIELPSIKFSLIFRTRSTDEVLLWY